MSTSHIPDYGTIITINKQDTNQNNNSSYDTNLIAPKNTHKSPKTRNKTCQSIGLISAFIILAIFALYHFGFVSLGTNNNLISLFQTNNKQLNTNNNNENIVKSDTWIPTPTIPDIGKRPTGECEVQCNHLCNGDIPCEDLCNVFPQFCYNDDGSHECQFISYCTDYSTYSTSPPQ